MRIGTQRAYGLVHLQTGLEQRHRRWEVSIYARNVGDKGYITSMTLARCLLSGGRPGEPRHRGKQFTPPTLTAQ